MALNPDRNTFSVAPVGNVVVIGRKMTLKGALPRDAALNLATWLLIAIGATPDEIAAEMKRAHEPIGVGVAPVPPAAQKVEGVPPQVVQQVAPFVGAVDRGEGDAIREGVERARRALEEGGGTEAPDTDKLSKAWGGDATGPRA